MGSHVGMALKGFQWFARTIELCCAAVVLAIFSYFLATLTNHHFATANWIRAVEGISGIAIVYTVVCLCLLCCLAGHPLTSSLVLLLDLAFAGAFIYVAWANRAGASSCSGVVDTPFGRGNADTDVVDNRPDGQGDITPLPSLRTACRMETACLAVSIAAVIFFLFSLLLEILLIRHRRKERRFGPGPANNYTSGYGTSTPTSNKRTFGNLFGLRGTRHATTTTTNMTTTNPNALPEHAQPIDFRDSYATEQTRINTNPGNGLPPAHNGYAAKYEAAPSPYAYGHDNGVVHHAAGDGGRDPPPPPPPPPPAPAAPPAAMGPGFDAPRYTAPTAGNYRYDDGVYDRA
ncbi:hypothetical protein B0T19DRAFT_400155 [Cercophora scortea]|uniref:MARVEL domain-containing protein n=1 Tax=Cercophora scortea TaxID=314031 RepID=A0AAE0ILD2_9PEZI|nr:hypothetical protein B0T19DRAFT_400155 [Cercophora scortea]